MVTITGGRKQSRSNYKGQANILPLDGASSPLHHCVNLGAGTGQYRRGRAGLRAPQGRPTGTRQLPVLQGGKDSCSSTFQASSLPLTPCLKSEIDPHTPAAQRKLMSKGLCLGLSIPLAFLGPLIVIIGATC